MNIALLNALKAYVESGAVKHLHGFYYLHAGRIFQICTQGTYTFSPCVRSKKVLYKGFWIWELEVEDLKKTLKLILPQREYRREIKLDFRQERIYEDAVT